MIFDAWERTYVPLKNHFDPMAAFEGRLFETYGAELNYVAGIADGTAHIFLDEWGEDPGGDGNVWTWVEADDGSTKILAGYHLVDRLGYFVTERKWRGFVEDIDVTPALRKDMADGK